MTKQNEFCFLCGSKNELVVEPNDEAFECWNCGNPQWIDDMTRLGYMLTRHRKLKEAETDLLKHRPHFCFVGVIDD